MRPRSARFLRVFQWALVIVGSWYWMQIVHELGHVVGAMITGGRVQRVVLELASFSRTDVDPNPRPLVVVWMGPIIGSLVPIGAWLLARRFHWRIRGLLGFFAGFCLIANGAYIGFGAFDHIGDAGDMRALGSPAWTLWTFGLFTMVGGLLVWHRTERRSVHEAPASIWPAAVFVATALVIVMLV